MPLTDRLVLLAVTHQAPGTSFADRLMIWLHVAFVIFTIGPVTIAILSTPRYIRTRNVAVLRYMLRTTRILVVRSMYRSTATLRVLMYRGVDRIAMVTGPIVKITKATCSQIMSRSANEVPGAWWVTASRTSRSVRGIVRS